MSNKFYTLEETIVREFHSIHRPQDHKVQKSVEGDWRCSCNGRNNPATSCKHIDTVRYNKNCGWLKIVGMRRIAHNERYIK